MTWLEMSINSVKEAVKLMNIPKPARLYLPVLPYIIEDDEAFAVFDNPYMQTYEKVVFEAEKMGHTLIAGRSGSGEAHL
jgi:DNA segregation ATPase FtsK/SpoIIIE-like protein